MAHPAKWYEWLIQTDECLATHTRPGECVGSGGPVILALLGVGLILVLLISYWWQRQKAKV